MLVAAVALLTASLAGSGTLEEGRLVRMGRGAQRLEAADGIPHAHEQYEPDSAPTGLVVAGPGWAATPVTVQGAPPGDASGGRTTTPPRSTSQLVWPIHTTALTGAPPGRVVRLAPHDLRPRSVRTIRPALGRAPPTA